MSVVDRKRPIPAVGMECKLLFIRFCDATFLSIHFRHFGKIRAHRLKKTFHPVLSSVVSPATPTATSAKMYSFVLVSLAAAAARIVNAQSLNALPDCAVSDFSPKLCWRGNPRERLTLVFRCVRSARGGIRKLCAERMRVFRPQVHLQRHRLSHLHSIRHRAEMHRRRTKRYETGITPPPFFLPGVEFPARCLRFRTRSCCRN